MATDFATETAVTVFATRQTARSYKKRDLPIVVAKSFQVVSIIGVADEVTAVVKDSAGSARVVDELDYAHVVTKAEAVSDRKSEVGSSRKG